MRKQTLAVVALALTARMSGAAERIAVSWNEGPLGPDQGYVALMDNASPWSLNSPLTIHRDSTLRFANGTLYAVSRTSRSVKIINLSLWSVSSTISLQNTDDLIDIAVVSSSLAYLTEANSMELIRLNLSNGNYTRVADMSAFASACGEALDRMALHEGQLFVQVGTAQTHHDERGCLGVVDVATDTLVDAVPSTSGADPITLTGTQGKFKMRVVPANPTGPADVDRLFVSASGAHFDNRAGLEAVDIDGLVSLGLVVEEDGTDFRGFALLDLDSGFISDGTDLTLSSHLFRFDGSQITNLQYDMLDYESPWLEISNGYLFFPEGGGNSPGVAVFAVSNGSHVGNTGTGLDPVDIERVVLP